MNQATKTPVPCVFIPSADPFTCETCGESFGGHPTPDSAAREQTQADDLTVWKDAIEPQVQLATEILSGMPVERGMVALVTESRLSIRSKRTSLGFRFHSVIDFPRVGTDIANEDGSYSLVRKVIFHPEYELPETAVTIIPKSQ